MTQVSVEGLKKVKQALQDFKNQAAPMSYTCLLYTSMAYKCLSLCGLFSFFDGFRKNLLHAGF